MNAQSRPDDRWRFGLWLLTVGVAAFVLRLGYVYFTRNQEVMGDGNYYHLIAGLLADGEGFIAPEPFLRNGSRIPWAVHPPAWPALLTGPALLGFRSFTEQQSFAAVIGAGTVVMVGLAGRRIAGSRVGIIAAVVAAIYPFFWRYERELLSETLVLFCVASVLLFAYSFLAQPSIVRAVAVAGLCGVLALTRAELALLVVALLVPLVLVASTIPLPLRIRWLAIAVAAWAIVLAPWAIYNTARFDEPVLLTHTLGYNLSIANCDLTYSGPRLGFIDDRCIEMRESNGVSAGLDPSSLDAERRRQGLEYMREHITRVPIVVLARIGRAWGIYRPIQQPDLEPDRGTPNSVTWASVIGYWVLLPVAVAGAIILRRARVVLFPLVAFIVIAVIAAALTFGYSRYRAPAEVSIVLLAAVAVDRVLPRRGRLTTGLPSELPREVVPASSESTTRVVPPTSHGGDSGKA